MNLNQAFAETKVNRILQVHTKAWEQIFKDSIKYLALHQPDLAMKLLRTVTGVSIADARRVLKDLNEK